MTRVLVVGCGFPQLSLVRAARRRGLHVVGADMNPRAVAVEPVRRVPRGVDERRRRPVRPGRPHERSNAVTTTGSEVVAQGDGRRRRAPAPAVPRRPRHGAALPGQGRDARRLRRAGVAVPDFARCRTLEEALAFARARRFPLVVKPSRGWGQRGVARVDDETQLARAFHEARAHSASAGLPLVVVESWLDGREYSVNGWIEAGRLAELLRYRAPHRPGKPPARRHGRGGVPVRSVRARRSARRRGGAPRCGGPRAHAWSVLLAGRPRTARAASCSRRPRVSAAASTPTSRGSPAESISTIASSAWRWATAALEQQGVRGPGHGGAVAKFLVARPGRVRAIEGLDAGARPRRVDDVGGLRARGRATSCALTDSAKRAAYVALARGDADRRRRRAPTRRCRSFTSKRRTALTPTQTNGTGSSGVWQLFKERRTRSALYGDSSYWDSRARRAERHGAVALALERVQRPLGRAPARAARPGARAT